MRYVGPLTVAITVAITIVGSAEVRAADPIPPERRIDWSEVGVPGGIPERTDVCATIDAATYGTMAVDAAPAIVEAIAACAATEAAPKVIEIPAGDYLLGSSIDLGETSWITFRGDGAAQTRLVPAGRAFRLGWGSATPIAVTVIGGATRGSTQLTVSGTEGVFEGGLLAIDRADDPALVFSTSGPGRNLRQLLRVTAISGNDITFEPPLFWDFDDAPQLTGFADMMTQGIGIEDMLFDHEGQGEGPSVFFDQCYGCWVRGIHSRLPLGYHTIAANSMRCEIRDSFFADSQTYGANNAGVALYGMNVGWKIENNIFYKTFPGIEAQNGTSANYFGYNFGAQVEAGWEYSGAMFSDNHGPHDMMNLWEGNVGEMFQSDGYFGSGSHATLFRNHFTASNPAKQGNFKAISLERWSYHYNVVGNLLGAPDGNFAYYDATADGYPYEDGTIYRLGYPNIGSNGHAPADGMGPPGIDPMVRASLLRVGNYDYVHACVWDDDAGACVEDPAALELPESMHYEAVPTWWPPTKPWPPFAPERDDFDAATPVHIPAHDCFDMLDLANGGAFDRVGCYEYPSGTDDTSGGSDGGTGGATEAGEGTADAESGNSGTAGVADSSGSGSGRQDEGSSGCGCTSDAPRGAGVLVLLGVLARRRRARR